MKAALVLAVLVAGCDASPVATAEPPSASVVPSAASAVDAPVAPDAGAVPLPLTATGLVSQGQPTMSVLAGRVRPCIRAAGAVDGGGARVQVTLSVAPSGSVRAVKLRPTGPISKEALACIEREARATSFGASDGGAELGTTFDFVMQGDEAR